jgi:hypothetical protein
VNRFRVHERDLEPEHPLARLAVDQLGPLSREVGYSRMHVVDFVGNVMHARAPLREKLADRRVVAKSGEELDPIVPDADRRRFDTLGVNAGTMLEATAEEAFVRAHRLVEIRDRDPDVVDSPCFHAVDATAASREGVDRLRFDSLAWAGAS